MHPMRLSLAALLLALLPLWSACSNEGREIIASQLIVSATMDQDGDTGTTGDQGPVSQCTGAFDLGAIIADRRDGGDVSGNRGRFDGESETLTLVGVDGRGRAIFVVLTGEAGMDYVDGATPDLNDAGLGVFAVEIFCGGFRGTDERGDPTLSLAVEITDDALDAFPSDSAATSALALAATERSIDRTVPTPLKASLFETNGTLAFTDLVLDPLGSPTLVTELTITLTDLLAYADDL